MAKRKRLAPTPQPPSGSQTGAMERRPALPLGAPPIAQVGADAATQAAFEELQGEMRRAREDGRLVQDLSMDLIDKKHLVRDRLHVDEEEMQVLMASIEARGQQTPIEVIDLGAGRYGLLSGWRRMTALERLGRNTVLALIRAPQTASEAYVAMVEENEIRVGLSYFERAAIVLSSINQGIFPDKISALQALFGSASKAKRSKIGGFLPIVATLGDALHFPTALTERFGLPLARALEDDPTLGPQLVEALQANSPATAVEEERLLREAWSPSQPAHQKPQVTRQELRPGVFLDISGGFTKPILQLSGPGVDPRFQARLEAWLKTGK